MKFASISVEGHPTWIASKDGESFLDCGEAFGCSSLRDAINSGLTADLMAGRRNLEGPLVNLGKVRFLPLIHDAARILCVGFNYRQHANETGKEELKHPTLFIRLPSSCVGHLEPIVRPRASKFLDWEGEIAIVLARGDRHIPRDRAWECVAGFTCFADNSVRDFQMHGTQATAGKNFDRTGSFGPWLVTRDEIENPAALEVVTRVNGEEVQHGSFSQLVFDVPFVIAYVSTFTTLEPGDVISMGTPAGIGARRKPPLFLKPGDVLEVEGSRIGVLKNTVIEETEDG